jgi:PAS domain S-box-containing protein
MEQRLDYEELLIKVKELEKEQLKRKEAEKALFESNQRYERLVNTIPCALYDYIRWPDGRSRFIYISSQCENIFEYDADQITEDEHLLWRMVHPEDIERLQQEDSEANQAKKLFQSEVRIILPSGKMKWIQLTSKPSAQKTESQVIWSGVILDITVRRQAEEERKKIIKKLQDALDDVKTLSGLLPICASCKKIRDDKGYWNQIEGYIQKHSAAKFSHSMCPECSDKLYGKEDWYIEMKNEEQQKE